VLPLALAAVAAAAPGRAADVGTATGTATIDETTTTLAFAVATRKHNLFDDKKQDIVVVLTDVPLGATKPDDEVELALRARRGELVVVALRIDGTTLVNVTVNHKGLKGLVVLPGPWFQLTLTTPRIRTIRLAKRDSGGHSFAIAAVFAAPLPANARPNTTPAPGAIQR
jgi:hypothetical protein